MTTVDYKRWKFDFGQKYPGNVSEIPSKQDAGLGSFHNFNDLYLLFAKSSKLLSIIQVIEE